MTNTFTEKRLPDLLDTIRHAIKVAHEAGLRVHHVEIGAFLWEQLQPSLVTCELRDDVGYGTHPGGPKAPVIDGVVLVPGMLVCMDHWALVFGRTGDAATDYALTNEQRTLWQGTTP